MFFFSSRRRHTRCGRDWSSDVCSSDLVAFRAALRFYRPRLRSVMTTDPAALRSGKGHHDENFPVASRLIHPRHRGAILAFYEFVRTADDIADHPSLPPPEKLALLDRLEATLLGKSNDDPVG